MLPRFKSDRFSFFSRLAIAAPIVVALAACGGGDGETSAGEPESAQVSADFETTPVAEGVWRFRWQSHNGLFVDTPEGVIVVDPISTEAAAVFAGEVQRTLPDKALLAVVYSHWHADHATGANVIRTALGSDAPVVAHENAVPSIEAAADPDLPVPDQVYDDLLVLAEGSRPVELHHLGPSHSDDQSVVVIPDVGVAFAVDFVAHDRVGYQELPSWHMPGQLTALDQLGQLDYETIVFGHGPNGDKGSVERQLAYYQALAAAVQEAIDDGSTADEAAESINLPEFTHWDQYDAWFPMNVRGMYRLLSEGG